MGHYAKVDSHPFQPQCFKLLLLPLAFDAEGPYVSNGTTVPRGPPGPPLCRGFMTTLKHTTG
jgi:hypothetical protein